MSLSDLLEVEVADSRVPERARAPLYAQPQQDESLASWWHRFARPFGLSAQCLSSAVMGSDQILARDWSIRPAVDLLAVTRDRTGIPMDALRSMTFLDWAQTANFDESSGRFSGRRYMDRAPKSPTRGLVVCPECLRSDEEPYVWVTWLIGRMAICPTHNRTMISRCPACRVALALPMPRSSRAFRAARCTKCSVDLRTEEMPRAVPTAQRLQSLLLEGKRMGMTNLTGIGPVSWRDILMLSDVVLGMFWQETSVERKWWLCREIAQDVGAGEHLDAG